MKEQMDGQIGRQKVYFHSWLLLKKQEGWNPWRKRSGGSNNVDMLTILLKKWCAKYMNWNIGNIWPLSFGLFFLSLFFYTSFVNVPYRLIQSITFFNWILSNLLISVHLSTIARLDQSSVCLRVLLTQREQISRVLSSKSFGDVWVAAFS